MHAATPSSLASSHPTIRPRGVCTRRSFAPRDRSAGGRYPAGSLGVNSSLARPISSRCRSASCSAGQRQGGYAADSSAVVEAGFSAQEKVSDGEEAVALEVISRGAVENGRVVEDSAGAHQHTHHRLHAAGKEAAAHGRLAQGESRRRLQPESPICALSRSRHRACARPPPLRVGATKTPRTRSPWGGARSCLWRAQHSRHCRSCRRSP